MDEMEIEEIFLEISKKKDLYSHYLHNFEKNFILGNISKSSEFLWGAVHSLLYAIALTYNKKLTKHGQIREFSKELTEIEKDDEIRKGILLGETLHSNFYQDFLDKEQLEIKKQEMEKLILKLEKILGKRINEIEKQRKKLL